MAELGLNHVSKRFGAVTAIDDLTLSLGERETLALIGPSGSGKTTTLRLIAGLEEPDSGTIALGNARLDDTPPKDRPVAFVRQSYALYPQLTVYENLALWPRLRQLPDGEVERRVSHVADRLGLRDLFERKPRQLRGGQRMRLALGRALTREPAVLLLDEPLAMLDAKLRMQTRPELIKMQRELAGAMLYATHDTQEAMALGQRVAVLRDGVLQQVDTPEAIYDRPANMFVAGFIGSPPINFFRSSLRQEAGRTIVDTGAFAALIPASLLPALRGYAKDSVILGLRPDDIADCAVAPPSGGEQPVRMSVNVVERLGRDVLLHLIAGPHYPVARVDARTNVRAGDILDVTLDTSRMHLFDPDTQRALAGPARTLGWGVDLGQRPV